MLFGEDIVIWYRALALLGWEHTMLRWQRTQIGLRSASIALSQLIRSKRQLVCPLFTLLISAAWPSTKLVLGILDCCASPHASWWYFVGEDRSKQAPEADFVLQARDFVICCLQRAFMPKRWICASQSLPERKGQAGRGAFLAGSIWRAVSMRRCLPLLKATAKANESCQMPAPSSSLRLLADFWLLTQWKHFLILSPSSWRQVSVTSSLECIMACRSQLVMQAVQALQMGLKREVKDADAWEALGCAYQSLGRLTAAIKVHLPLLA